MARCFRVLLHYTVAKRCGVYSMAKIPYLKLSKDVLKFDRNELNKQVFYPIISAGYNVAKNAAMTHRKTGQLARNLKTVSLAKRSTNDVGYVMFAGRRSDYSDNTPHFLLYYTVNNGKIYREIKRKVSSEIKKLN